MKDLIITLTGTIVLVIALIMFGNYWTEYKDSHSAIYEFTVTDKWQDTHGKFLKGASTAYNIEVRVVKVRKGGKWIADQSFQTIQTKRVSHRFYNSHEVGSKWTGSSPHLFRYDR